MSTVVSNRQKRMPQKCMQRVVLTVAPRKYGFLMELLQNFDFVKVAKDEDNDGDLREEVVANLKQTAKDLKLLKVGKLKTRPLKEFLDEL